MSSRGADESTDGPPTDIDTDWFRFGVVITVLHLLFLGLIVALLQIDVVLALVVAVVLSVAGGIGITLYVLRWK